MKPFYKSVDLIQYKMTLKSMKHFNSDLKNIRIKCSNNSEIVSGKLHLKNVIDWTGVGYVNKQYRYHYDIDNNEEKVLFVLSDKNSHEVNEMKLELTNSGVRTDYYLQAPGVIEFADFVDCFEALIEISEK